MSKVYLSILINLIYIITIYISEIRMNPIIQNIKNNRQMSHARVSVIHVRVYTIDYTVYDKVPFAICLPSPNGPSSHPFRGWVK